MNAVLKPQRRFQAMLPSDLSAVLTIERAAYEFPWSRGNFLDSLHAGYLALLMYDEHQTLAGYFVAMAGVEEMHLLNLSVAPDLQGSGHARAMLDFLQEHCRNHAAAMLWLEVRTGNQRARRLYTRYGFSEIGIRRNYYPGAATTREDAVVMSLATVQQPPSGPCRSVADGLD